MKLTKCFLFFCAIFALLDQGSHWIRINSGSEYGSGPQHCSKWYSMHCTVLKIADTMWLLLPLWPLLPTTLLVSCKSVQVNQFYDLQFCFCLLRDLPVVKCGRKPHYYRSFVPPTQKLGIKRGIVCALQSRNNRETRHSLSLTAGAHNFSVGHPVIDPIYPSPVEDSAAGWSVLVQDRDADDSQASGGLRPVRSRVF
jgi:hypothetical protein